MATRRRIEPTARPGTTDGHTVEFETEVAVVTLRFVASDVDAVAASLARYVITSRGHDGCINIDLCRSSAESNIFVILEKWTTPITQRAHFDSPDMVRMATDMRGVLQAPPTIELLDPISAHDLR